LEPSLKWDYAIKMNLKDLVCHNADFVKCPTNNNLVTKSRPSIAYPFFQMSAVVDYMPY